MQECWSDESHIPTKNQLTLVEEIVKEERLELLVLVVSSGDVTKEDTLGN